MATDLIRVSVYDIMFDCEVSTWPAYRGARDSFNGRAGAGLQLEPDEEAGFEIEKITIPSQGPIDFEDMLSVTHAQIEEAVLEELNEQGY